MHLTRPSLLLFVLALLWPAQRTAAQDLAIGLMPAVDSVPLLVAAERGYFADEGVEVELRMFRNQLYRETALQTGEIDGSVSDLVNAVYAWRNGSGLRVGSITHGRFALLTAPGTEIRTVADWQAADQVTVGLLENSIIYYVAERMLETAGASPERIDLVTTMQVPTRMEMLLAGRIEAALLPEPVSRVAESRGATILLETDVLPSTPGVLIFTSAALEEKTGDLRALYRAYNRAVSDLQGDTAALRPAIVRRGEFPPSVEETMVLPSYERARAPTEAELADVLDWMQEKELIDGRPSYTDIVAAEELF